VIDAMVFAIVSPRAQGVARVVRGSRRSRAGERRAGGGTPAHAPAAPGTGDRRHPGPGGRSATAGLGAPSPDVRVAPPLGDGRFLLYLGAAAALHAVAYVLAGRGITLGDDPVLLHRSWAIHVAFLGCMAVARYAGARARAFVLLASAAVTLGVVAVPTFVALVAFTAVTYAIARLPWTTWARALLVLGACAAIPVVRAGWLGGAAQALLGTPRPFDVVLWSVVPMRAVLYQVELPGLALADRTFAGYLGSFTLVPLAGRGYLPPIPYGQLLGAYGTAKLERNLQRGLGLLALGLLYQCIHSLLALPYVHGPMAQLAAAAAGLPMPVGVPGAPATSVAGGGLRVAIALGLYWPATYFHAAGQVFVGIGNLRLLGFNLPSGFRAPLLSRNFVDLWKRWNHYYYDAMMTAYLPLLGWMRHRMPVARAALLAAVVVFLSEAAVRDVLSPVGGLVAPPSGLAPVWVPAARRLVVGAITVVTLYLLVRRRRAAPPVGLLALLWRRALTIGVAAVMVTGAQMLIYRLLAAGGPR
jgi:hypothetical protein